MKNYQIIELADKLKRYSNELKGLRGAKFSYTIIKNSDLIEKETKIIQSIIEVDEKYKSYESERISMCEKFAKKDNTGNFIKKNVNGDQYEYDIDVNDPNFLTEFQNLKDTHKDTIEVYEQKVREYNKFLLDDSIIEFNKINIEDVPNDISVELMSVISPFIN